MRLEIRAEKFLQAQIAGPDAEILACTARDSEVAVVAGREVEAAGPFAPPPSSDDGNDDEGEGDLSEELREELDELRSELEAAEAEARALRDETEEERQRREAAEERARELRSELEAAEELLDEAVEDAILEGRSEVLVATGTGKTLVFCVTDDHADLVVKLFKEALEAQYGAVRDDTVAKITGAADRPQELIRYFRNEK